MSNRECILIVEDEQKILSALRDFLEYKGFKVFEAVDGLEALIAATNTTYLVEILADTAAMVIDLDAIETLLGVEIVDEADIVTDMQEYARKKAAIKKQP